MRLFKRKSKPERSSGPRYLTGAVRFVYGDRIMLGTIFGKPYKKDISGFLEYYIESGDRVYTIPSHAIEEVKRGEK